VSACVPSPYRSGFSLKQSCIALNFSTQSIPLGSSSENTKHENASRNCMPQGPYAIPPRHGQSQLIFPVTGSNAPPAAEEDDSSPSPSPSPSSKGGGPSAFSSTRSATAWDFESVASSESCAGDVWVVVVVVGGDFGLATSERTLQSIRKIRIKKPSQSYAYYQSRGQ